MTYLVTVHKTDGKTSENSGVADIQVNEGVLVLRWETGTKMFPLHTIDEVITMVEEESL